MKTKSITTKKNTKKAAKKAPKKVTKKALKAAIGALAKSNIWKDVDKIAETLTYMVMEAFPDREYVRHAESMLKVADYDAEICYTYVFEVDAAYYRIRTVTNSGVYTIGPYDDFDYNQEEINLSVKAIREWVENFERKASGEEGAEGKKYEFTGETKEVYGHTLHRIRALHDITDPSAECWVIKKDDIGGWIESEKNLSHEDAAWVDCEACVYGDAKVYDNGYVSGNAQVFDDAEVFGEAKVSGNAQVYGHAKVYDGAQVFGDAEVFDSAEVYGMAEVYGNADVCGYSEVYGEAEVKGDAQVYDSAEVYGKAEVYGDAEVYGNAKVYEDADVCGNAEVYGSAKVCGDTKVEGETGEPEESTDTAETMLSRLESTVKTLVTDVKANAEKIELAVKEIERLKKRTRSI